MYIFVQKKKTHHLSEVKQMQLTTTIQQLRQRDLGESQRASWYGSVSGFYHIFIQ